MASDHVANMFQMAKTRSLSGQCPLCLSEGDVRESHVLPSFIFRSMKLRSATGHIRYSDSPNRRTQDGLKKPWLCNACEGLLSKEETAFATKLFHPWLGGSYTIPYTEWLLRFCVSVSWRVLRHCKGINPGNIYTAEQERLISCAEGRWRQFLLGEVPHPAEFSQQLVIFDVIDGGQIEGLPNNINRFLLGTVGMDVIGSDRSLMTYAKLGRFIIFGLIQPGPVKWEGAKVHVRQGVIQPTKYVLPYTLLEFLKDKARETAAIFDQISDAQLDKIEAEALRDKARLANSETLKAMMADADLFGDSAVIRRKRHPAR